MFCLFLTLELKLHINFDLGSTKKKQDMQNLFSHDYTKRTKNIETERYKCDFIKNSQDSIIQLQKLDLKSEIIIQSTNLNYNTNLNNVEIKQTTINCIKKHVIDHNPNPLIVIKNSDFKSTSSVIQGTATLNSDAQIIRFIGEGIHIITDTDINLIKKQNFQQNELLLLNEFDPTLIVFDDLSNNTINDSKFYNNQNGDSKSLEFYPARCIRTKKKSSLKVSNTIFFNGTSYHKGSFLLLESNNYISIFNSQFESCYDHENCAHAIFANQGKISVQNSFFKNVLSNPSSKGSIILSETNIFNFEGNKFRFNNNSIDCNCILLPNEGIFNITKNEFNNFLVNKNGAVIIIEEPSDILFNENEFKNIKGTGTSHSIYLYFQSMINRTISGTKLKNIHSADGFLCIRTDDEIETNFTFNRLNFYNVGQNGGGAINVDNPENKTYILIFQDCYFSSNKNVDGGSLLINHDTFPYCRGLSIIYCEMHFNSATGRGGALATFIDGDINIIDCHFNLNTAEVGGGSIYIENNKQSKCNCNILESNFNRNNGKKAHCIWVNVLSYDDDFTLQINGEFCNNNDIQYGGGACILSNCKATKVFSSKFMGNEIEYQCGGINVTAKGILEVEDCTFKNCNAGTIEGSYGGGIGYSYLKSSNSDRTREENITITNCEFNGNRGIKGVALMLNVLTINVVISDVNIVNHKRTNYIFCIVFNFETDNEVFKLTRCSFTENSFDSLTHDGECGGSGIYISEERSQNYTDSLTLVFDHCTFNNNTSPTNGGAFGYDSIDSLNSVEFEFIECTFTGNSCDGLGGACYFSTKKTVIISYCNFTENLANGSQMITGGGALSFYSSVELVTITNCNFINCKSTKGSFIYTNDTVSAFDIYDCTFQSLSGEHSNSVYLDVDSSAEIFNFENNDFIDFECNGEYGGCGLHIVTGIECFVKSCTFKGNKGESQIIIPDDSSNKLIFERCIFEKGKGSRAIYIKGESPVGFESCTFENFDDRTSENGRGLLIYSLSEYKITINNCSFYEIYCISALDFEKSLMIEITYSNFTKVQTCQSNTGGLLFITKAFEFLLTNCKMKECGCIDGINNTCFKLCESIETAEIINCSFDKCGRCTHGASIIAQNVSLIKIINSIFSGNMAQGISGDTLCVYIDKNTNNCEISNCQVHTRRKAYIKEIFEFRVFSIHSTFINNIFDKNFDNASISDGGFGGIDFSNTTDLHISNNIFAACNTAINANNVEEINIINNTFQDLYGNPGPRAFYIKTTLDSLTFRNNTIKNCTDTHNNLMTFSAKEIIIEECIFSSNKCSHPIGGGIGIMFDCSEFKVIFNNCTFKENNGNEGGGLQFGGFQSEENSNTGKLEIYSCIFEGNSATGTGGALSFTTKKENIIQNCTFKSNHASRSGGSISIISLNRDGGYISADESGSNNLIINCQFIDEKSDKDIHSIFIMNKGRTIIDSCRFSNMKTGNIGAQLVVQRNNNWQDSDGFLEVTNSSFKSTVGCYGIEIRYKGLSTINKCTFDFENSQTKGNSVKMTNSGKYNEIYDNIFNILCNNSYAVYCTGEGIDFYSNEINFNDNDQSCGFIEIYYSSSTNCEHRIHDNHFHDCKVNEKLNGVFHYNFVSGGSSSVLIIENNIFERLNGKFAAFYIEIIASVHVTFENNTIQNNQPSSNQYLCGFNFKGNYTIQNKFSIINCKFNNNTCSSQNGGGIGIMIHNTIGTEININNVFPFEFVDCLFDKNNALYTSSENSLIKNGNGGAIQIGSSNATMIAIPIFTNCKFLSNYADNEGGAISVCVLGNVEIDNCILYNNTAGSKSSEGNSINGGSLFLQSDFSIKNCVFEENKAFYDNNKIKGKGGAIYIKNIFDNETFIGWDVFSGNETIENCTFKSNQGYYGYAIYIEGEDENLSVTLNNNSFIDNFDIETLDLKSSIIESEICNFQNEEVIQENYFSNELNGKKIKVKKLSCYDDPTEYFSLSFIFSQSNDFITSNIFSKSNDFSKSTEFSNTEYFSKSTEFSKSNKFSMSLNFVETNVFSYSSQFSNSNKFSESSLFSNSNDFSNSIPFNNTNEFAKSSQFSNSNEFSNSFQFSKTNVFSKTMTDLSQSPSISLTPTQSVIPIDSSFKITYSVSFSLTYVDKKSVSFSISFLASNTFEMIYDEINETYILVASQTIYQKYFPYIIHYLSPLYIEQTFVVISNSKNKLTPEKLIGISCGSASVFFLILGIIILSFKKKNELKKQIEEFDDYSLSSEGAQIIRTIHNETNIDNNQAESNNEYNSYHSEIWI